MDDTRKWFEYFFNSKEMRDSSGAIKQGWIDFIGSGKAYEIWKACQSLNDKRIQQLLAVIEAQRKALLSLDIIEHDGGIGVGLVDCVMRSDVESAIAIKPENVELVEVGDFAIHEDKVGTRYPSQRMAYGYDEFKIGEINKLYTIKHK